MEAEVETPVVVVTFPLYPWGYPSTPGGTTPFQCILSRHHVRLEPLQAQGMLRAAHGVSW